MGNEISTIGGAVATAATAVAAVATLGIIDDVNEAVVHCARFTAMRAQNTVVRHAGETVVMGVATAGVAAVVVLTVGQVGAVKQATIDIASRCGSAAVKTGSGVFQIADQVTDGIPVVGHVKGGILYACGDSEGGARALKCASRTVGVIGGGFGGFMVGGPAGAAVGGVAAGAAMDGITTGIDSAVHGEYRPHGQIECWTQVVHASNADDRIAGIIGGVLTPVMDGFAGYTAGKTVAKMQQNGDLARIGKYFRRKLDLTRKELMRLRRRLARRGLQAIRATDESAPPTEIRQITYHGDPVPQEYITNDAAVVRGDQRLLLPANGPENTSGIPPRGIAADVIDQVKSKVVPKSRSARVLRRVKLKSRTHRTTNSMAKPRSRVDVQLAPRLLDHTNPNRLQIDGSIAGGHGGLGDKGGVLRLCA